MFKNLQPALVITRREIQDQMRDWRIIIPIVVLTLVFPAIMNITAEKLVNFMGQYGAEVLSERMIPFLLMIVGFFPISVSLVIALESFAGEKERGSIEPLLSSPLADWQLYLGKLLAVMLPPLIAAYLGIFVYLVGVYRNIGWLPAWDLLILMLTLTFVQALVMVSGAVVISTQATSVRAANLLASFIILPVVFLIQWESVVIFWGATSIRTWFQIEVRGIVKKIRVPFLIMLGLFVGVFAIGVNLAGIYVIPPDLITISDLSENILENVESLTIFSSKGVALILFQNIRVILIATVLGFFSYGVLGMLIVLIPSVLIGYFTVPINAAGIPTLKFLAAMVLPHGIFEIPAILLAGAAIYRIGASLATPAEGKSISEGFLRAFADWAKIMLSLVIPLLILGAIFEAFVTPQAVKLLLGQ